MTNTVQAQLFFKQLTYIKHHLMAPGSVCFPSSECFMSMYLKARQTSQSRGEIYENHVLNLDQNILFLSKK